MAEYKKFIRCSVASTGTTSVGYTELAMPIQRGFGKGHNMGVCLHAWEIRPGSFSIMGANEGCMVGLFRNVPTAVGDFSPSNANLIDMIECYSRGAPTEMIYTKDLRKDHSPPILIAAEKIYIGLYNTDSGNAQTLTARLEYTVRFISEDELYAALNNQ